MSNKSNRPPLSTSAAWRDSPVARLEEQVLLAQSQLLHHITEEPDLFGNLVAGLVLHQVFTGSAVKLVSKNLEAKISGMQVEEIKFN